MELVVGGSRFPFTATPSRQKPNPKVIVVATARKIAIRNAVGSKAVAMISAGWRNTGALGLPVVGMPAPGVN
jgi:hypothetical protein